MRRSLRVRRLAKVNGAGITPSIEAGQAPSAAMQGAQPCLRLQDYSDAVAEGWRQADLYRAIMHELPRLFHSLDQEAQRQVINDAPGLTGSAWDALMAAVVEHVATLHGHELPAWVQERERFLDVPWIISQLPLIRYESLAFAPAAFIRHGALPDPRDLDARGGERHAWAP